MRTIGRCDARAGAARPPAPPGRWTGPRPAGASDGRHHQGTHQDHRDQQHHRHRRCAGRPAACPGPRSPGPCPGTSTRPATAMLRWPRARRPRTPPAGWRPGTRAGAPAAPPPPRTWSRNSRAQPDENDGDCHSMMLLQHLHAAQQVHREDQQGRAQRVDRAQHGAPHGPQQAAPLDAGVPLVGQPAQPQRPQGDQAQRERAVGVDPDPEHRHQHPGRQAALGGQQGHGQHAAGRSAAAGATTPTVPTPMHQAGDEDPPDQRPGRAGEPPGHGPQGGGGEAHEHPQALAPEPPCRPSRRAPRPASSAPPRGRRGP